MLSFFRLSSVWHPSSAAQARHIGLEVILPLLQGSVGQFLLPAPCPVALVHRTLKGVCSHSVRTPLTKRERISSMKGARRDCRDYGMLISQGLAARVCFPNSLPSQRWRVPGCCCNTHHPPVAWPGLGESTNPPCFSRKTESQSSTVLPLLSHWLCWSGLAQGSVLRSCSFPLGGGKNGSQMDPLQ